MKQNQPALFTQIASVLVMMLALFWLLVSLPFIHAAQQVEKQAIHANAGIENDEVPFTDTNEEKSKNGKSTVIEYLNELSEINNLFTLLRRCFKCHSDDVYVAFHSELISPPPDA